MELFIGFPRNYLSGQHPTRLLSQVSDFGCVWRTLRSLDNLPFSGGTTCNLIPRFTAYGIAELTADSWGTLAPATWNWHVATLRSFTAFCRRTGWLQVDLCAGRERRPEKADHTKAVGDTSLERLFRREDVPIREKCLWRLLHETAARAGSPLPQRRGRRPGQQARQHRGQGGNIEWLHLQSGSARLLPRIIAGSQTGAAVPRRPAPRTRPHPSHG